MEETVLLDVQRIQTSEQSSIILHSVRAVDLVNHLVPEYTSSIATASHTTSKKQWLTAFMPDSSLPENGGLFCHYCQSRSICWVGW